MDEHLAARYWCHMCSTMVNPIMGAEIECPICNGGFVEEMNWGGEAATPPDLESNRDLSLWAPILHRMLSGGSMRHRRIHREEEEGNSDRDHDTEAALIRWQQRSSAILRILNDLREGNVLGSDGDDNDRARERDRVHILMDLINNAIDGSLDANLPRGQSSNNSNNGDLLRDYFLGSSLELLLQHLAESDPNFYGTPPAQKSAVEAMPTVKITENMSCSICLDDFEIGTQAREMPCKHKFHGNCILPWLELHSSCPVCRFQMPSEESKVSDAANREELHAAGGGSTGSSDNGNGGSERGSWLPVPWPFNGLFSLLGSHRSGTSSSTQPSSSTSPTRGDPRGHSSSSSELKMYQHQLHQGHNNLLSPKSTFSPERQLFLQRGSASKDSGLVLSTDAKPRLKWNAELHKRFTEAVNQLGGPDKATPKTIMRLMGIPGLTLYHLKSHLQKYRLGKNVQAQISNGSNKNVFGSSLVQERAPDCNESLMNIGPSNKTMQINEALKMQIEVQRQLHEQLEVQRHLQQQIETQGKYLQSVLEKAQETITKQSLSSAGLEGAKIHLSDLAFSVANGYFSNSFQAQENDYRVYTCLASSKGLQNEKEAFETRTAISSCHQDFLLSSWYSDMHEQKKPFAASILRDSDIKQSNAKPQYAERDGAFLPEVKKEERDDEHSQRKSTALGQASRKRLEEFGLPCLKTELELNTHHDGEEGTSSCRELDLNGFSWSL
ncbi:hypothetical protein ZIOFF_012655 [Zingiber officinale]|uniref:RING-type E3 ubiquitin transferase n=2 Tax=Zingiber officinale TaxID=94328 RepID=A0A8J5HSP5_ZINOF|nr:hypothetical protein ZIOFF_012655 [Zingiber officinale]